MKNNFFVLVPFIFLFTSTAVLAQSYIACAGIRLGTEWGVTGKYLVSPELHLTAEGIVQQSFRTQDGGITLLLEQHKSLLTRRFNIYYGGGVHYFWLANKVAEVSNPKGISLIAGAEFTLGRLNISWDVKPALHVAGGSGSLLEIQSGVSLRYVFERRIWRVDWNALKFWKKKS